MAKSKVEPGDEFLIRVLATAVWPDGSITFQVRSTGQRVTVSDSDVESVTKDERAAAVGKRDLFK